MEPEDFFVGVYDPVDVRRNVLESSKEIIKSLQTYDSLKKTRVTKLELYNQMNRIMKELDLLVGKMQKKLPKSHLRKAIETGKVTRNSKNEKLPAELEKLQDQLKAVEKELSSLD
jgi:23S rRNA-/tRNA-specific pseudouridylate synthase